MIVTHSFDQQTIPQEAAETALQLASQGFNILLVSNINKESANTFLKTLKQKVDEMTQNGTNWREHMLYWEFKDYVDEDDFAAP